MNTIEGLEGFIMLSDYVSVYGMERLSTWR